MQKEIMYAPSEGEFPNETDNDMTLKDAHDDYYDSRSIIPADNVDADGVPWATVGENIRKGAKVSSSKEKILEALSTLIGMTLSYEEVNCTLAPNEYIIVDNPIFSTTKYAIYSNTKLVVGFFILSSNITSGYANLGFQTANGVNRININMQNVTETGLTGTLKIGVLVA